MMKVPVFCLEIPVYLSLSHSLSVSTTLSLCLSLSHLSPFYMFLRSVQYRVCGFLQCAAVSELTSCVSMAAGPSLPCGFCLSAWRFNGERICSPIDLVYGIAGIPHGREAERHDAAGKKMPVCRTRTADRDRGHRSVI